MLYEVITPEVLQLIPIWIEKATFAPCRITSYNVCYTKLLRSEVPLTASISENLADIYQDLKDFALSYRTGDEFVMQEALWECVDNFKNYWGQKLRNNFV